MAAVIMIGDGGHAGVLRDALCLSGIEIAAVALGGEGLVHAVGRANVAISDEDLMGRSTLDHLLVNGVGGVDVPQVRRRIFCRFRDAGFTFLTVQHPSAVVARDVSQGLGVQVMAGAIVQPHAKIGDNVLINTRAVVEHDCVIGDHVHVATGAVLAGAVHIGSESMIGAGAVVRQGIKIGSGVLVAAGAVVISDIADKDRVAGVPARPMRSRTS